VLRSLARWCLIGIASMVLCACRTDLLTQISESDANDVLDALYSAGIEASKAQAGDKMFTVQVSESRMGDALRVMQERGLPRPRHADLGVLFKKEGLISTPSEERVRFVYGVAQQLSATLTRIPGVLYASVQPVIPSNDPLADKIKPSSASVLIKHDPNANVEALRPAIKDLVMRGIEGLNHDNISLTLVAADPPQRIVRVEPVLPTWVVTSLSLLAGAAVLAVAAAGFMLWRMQRTGVAQNLERPYQGPVQWFGDGGRLNGLTSRLRGLQRAESDTKPSASTDKTRVTPLRSVPTDKGASSGSVATP
jgi:type III secretion protein J